MDTFSLNLILLDGLLFMVHSYSWKLSFMCFALDLATGDLCGNTSTGRSMMKRDLAGSKVARTLPNTKGKSNSSSELKYTRKKLRSLKMKMPRRQTDIWMECGDCLKSKYKD